MTTPIPGPPASVLSAILVTNTNDPGSPMSVAMFSQSGEPPDLPSLMNDVVAMPEDALLDSNATFTGFLSTLGLTGAVAPARWVGSTAAGAPTTGTFLVGDFAVSADGNVYVCTVAGSPGTWTASGSALTGTAGGDMSGTYPNPVVAKVNGSAASGQYARGNGTALAMSAILAADLPSATSGVQGATRLGNDLGGTAAAPTVVSTHLASALPRAQGGTGLTTTPAAPANYYPANPTATASQSGIGGLVMMGLGVAGGGNSCVYTPASSGNVLVMVSGNVITNTAAAQITLGGRYGTGTPPSNGAAVTGTRFGAATDQNIRAASFAAGVPFALQAILALTPSTAAWIDIALDTFTAADTAQITSVGVSICELS